MATEGATTRPGDAPAIVPLNVGRIGGPMSEGPAPSRGLQVATLVVAVAAAVFSLWAVTRAQAALEAAERAAEAASFASVGDGRVDELMQALIDAGVIRDPYTEDLEGLALDELEAEWCEDWGEVAGMLTFDREYWGSLRAETARPVAAGDATEYHADVRSLAGGIADRLGYYGDRWSTADTLPFPELLDAIAHAQQAHLALSEDASSVPVARLADQHLAALANDQDVRAALRWSDDTCR